MGVASSRRSVSQGAAQKTERSPRFFYYYYFFSRAVFYAAPWLNSVNAWKRLVTEPKGDKNFTQIYRALYGGAPTRRPYNYRNISHWVLSLKWKTSTLEFGPFLLLSRGRHRLVLVPSLFRSSAVVKLHFSCLNSASVLSSCYSWYFLTWNC